MSGYSRWKRSRFRLEECVFVTLGWLARRLTRRGVVRVANVLGDLAWKCSAQMRHITLANLDLAFGETKSAAEKERIGRASCQNFARTMLGLLSSPAQSLANIVEVDAAQWQQVESIRAQGKGIIFLTLHFGDWETIGLATSQREIRFMTVMETSRNARLDARLATLRAQTGCTIIPQEGAAMKLYRTLRRGGCVASLIDLNAPMRFGGVWVDFFGKPVFNNSAIAGLALRTGAPIIIGLGYPIGDTGKVRLDYRPLPPFQATGDYDADVLRLSQLCLRVGEDVIRETPELWLWSYKRWKRTPTPDLTGFPFYARYPQFKRKGAVATASQSE